MLLVAGNAALSDLIVQVNALTASEVVGRIIGGPGAEGRWLPGGSALTVALAARRAGAAVALWHRLPDGAVASLLLTTSTSAGMLAASASRTASSRSLRSVTREPWAPKARATAAKSVSRKSSTSEIT